LPWGTGCYIAALLSFTPKILYVAAPYAAAAFALSPVSCLQKLRQGKNEALAGGVYLAELLCLMAGCAAGAAVYALSPGSILFAIGGLFFLMSRRIC
jgi:hypothetical protein